MKPNAFDGDGCLAPGYLARSVSHKLIRVQGTRYLSPVVGRRDLSSGDHQTDSALSSTQRGNRREPTAFPNQRPRFASGRFVTMKRTASDVDADETTTLPSKRLKTEFGPKPTSSVPDGKQREGAPQAEAEGGATGKSFPKLELAYPSKSPPSANRGPPVPFQQPTPLTTFSYDSKRELRFDDSALRYYVDPPHGADLRYGYESWVKRPEEKGRLDGLLKAWAKVRNGFPDGFMNGGVIAWRGVMTRYVKIPLID